MNLGTRLAALEARRAEITARRLTDVQWDKLLRRMGMVYDTEGRAALVAWLARHMGAERAEAAVLRLEAVVARRQV